MTRLVVVSWVLSYVSRVLIDIFLAGLDYD